MEEKEFETYEVEIYEDQVYLSYCSIAGNQQYVPVLQRTEEQFKHGHN